jgi:Flp pilus assembly protein TadG
MFTRFLQERKGSVLPIFAISVIPIIGFVGVAVDFSRAGSARADMQSALDGTALMLSKDAPKLSTADLQTRATDYFNSMFTRPEASGITVTPTYNVSNSTYTLKVTASGAIEGTFSRVLGVKTLGFGGSSEVTWGIKRLELALALDNTGSMASNNKMTELKKAAKELLDTLYKAAKSTGDIKVAVIPFATDVNVGTNNVNASWLDWSDWNEENGHEEEAVCYNKKGKVKKCKKDSKTWVPDSHTTWNGCVTDRDQPNDALDTTPSVAIASTMFVPHQADNCPTTILPLVDIMSNWSPTDLTSGSPSSVLGKKINAMTPNGNTNVSIGLAWGWHALTSNAPLPEGSAPKEDLDKVIILLTDGDNTQNRWNDPDDANNAVQRAAQVALIDARTKATCDNVKAANIKLYTIRVIDGNSALLQSCATKTDMYYDVENAAQLNTVFSAIATNLANLRIAK